MTRRPIYIYNRSNPKSCSADNSCESCPSGDCPFSIFIPIDPDSGTEQFRDWNPAPDGWDKRSFYDSLGPTVSFQYAPGYPAALFSDGAFFMQDNTDGCKRWRILKPDCNTCTFVDITAQAVVGGVIQQNCTPPAGFLNSIPTMICE